MEKITQIWVADIPAMHALASKIAALLHMGDCVCLSGELGAGKTEFARGLITALDPTISEVPSPTFAMIQPYEILASQPHFILTHADLYRVEEESELDQLGLSDALAQGMLLVEWPDIAQAHLPKHRLHIQIAQVNRAVEGRRCIIQGDARWISRWQEAFAAPREHAIESFLRETSWGDAKREKLAGDASFRHYERLTLAQKSGMLMNAPPAYEDVRPFVRIAKWLHEQGFSSPQILAADEENGLLLLEDLGDDLFSHLLTQQRATEEELYDAAVDVLAALHQPERTILPLAPYDHAQLMREVQLLCDWALPAILLGDQYAGAAQEYLAVWDGLLKSFPPQQHVFVHRDYHADNLLWLSNRAGVARVGLLDFQDALLGSPAYDLVSLLEDARRDVSPHIAERERQRYATLMQMNDAQMQAFLREYALLGAQRNCKIIGIFHRLSLRDGKARYETFLPRVWAYLREDVQHPALAPLRQWMQQYGLLA